MWNLFQNILQLCLDVFPTQLVNSQCTYATVYVRVHVYVYVRMYLYAYVYVHVYV